MPLARLGYLHSTYYSQVIGFNVLELNASSSEIPDTRKEVEPLHRGLRSQKMLIKMRGAFLWWCN